MQCSTNDGSRRRVCPGTWLALILVAGLIIYAFVSLRTGPRPLKTAGRGEVLPASSLAFPDLNGKIFNLSEHRGNVVLVNFWASWCGPCVSELPELAKVAGKYADKGLSVIGVSLDETGPATVRRFVEERKVPYPILLPNGDSPVLSGIRSIPVTLLIDRQGRVAMRYDGEVTEQVLSEDIERLLAEV